MMMRGVAPMLLLALTSCALPANVVVLLPDEDGTVGQATVQEGGSTARLDKPLSAVNAGSEVSLGSVFIAPRSDIEGEFAGALDATPRAPRVYLLYFLSGSTELDSRSRGDLAAASAAANTTANIDISVVGHADATGSDAFNQALSLRRAEIVRDGLVGVGVPSEVIEIAYHGANNPLVPTPRGVSELRNRRVEVTIR